MKLKRYMMICNKQRRKIDRDTVNSSVSILSVIRNRYCT